MSVPATAADPIQRQSAHRLKLEKLEKLCVVATHLQDITGNIRYLDASKNQLTSLQEASLQLQHLSNLQQLILARNRLLDVSGLQLMPDLRVLNLSRNKITDLTPFEVRLCFFLLPPTSTANCISTTAQLP